MASNSQQGFGQVFGWDGDPGITHHNACFGQHDECKYVQCVQYICRVRCLRLA